MGIEWVPVPLNTKVFENVPEEALTRAHAELENAFVTEADGVSRFPGLKVFKEIGGTARQYLGEFRGDMVAVGSDGRFNRVDKGANVENVTGVPLLGGHRVSFAETPDALLTAAGGPIIQFAGTRTAVLSDDAPIATHIGYIDNFVVAGEAGSDRWFHCQAGAYRLWDPLDTFAASGTPDIINSILITPFREMLFAGDKSVEQFERLPSGDPPFFRRWSVGEGVTAPYTLCFEDNAAWGINQHREFVRFSGQVSQPISDDIGRTLEAIDNWNEAWATPIQVLGQKFILLAAPFATNRYGGKGVTYLYDYRQKRWSSLFGWDVEQSRPGRWPGWSYLRLWDRHFVGGEGVIYELTTDTYNNAGQVARLHLKTAHLSELGEICIDNLRMRLKRGTGSYTANAQVSIRAIRDNQRIGNWVRRSLGKTGERFMYIEFGGFGWGHSWQFEIDVTDDTPVEIVKLEAQLTPTAG